MSLTEFIIRSAAFINLTFLFLFIYHAWKFGYISKASLYLKLIVIGVIVFIVVNFLSVTDIFLKSLTVRTLAFVLSLVAVLSMTVGVVIRGANIKKVYLISWLKVYFIQTPEKFMFIGIAVLLCVDLPFNVLTTWRSGTVFDWTDTAKAIVRTLSLAILAFGGWIFYRTLKKPSGIVEDLVGPLLRDDIAAAGICSTLTNVLYAKPLLSFCFGFYPAGILVEK